MGPKKALITVVLCLFGIPLGGCEPLDKIVSQLVEKHLAKRKDDLDMRLSKLEMDHAETKGKVSGLDFGHKLTSAQLSGINNQKASVSDGDGYAVARTPLGPVLVTMEKIQPHLDGYRVTLNIGNPTTINFRGAELEVEWGLPWTDGRKFEEIQRSRKSKKFSFPKDFNPGAYTQVELALTPAKPEEVKSIDVGVDWNRLSMRKPVQPQ